MAPLFSSKLLVVTVVALLVLGLGIFPSFVDAQTPASAPAEAQLPAVGETAPLELGQRAPWAGMLVRDDDLFGLQTAVMQCRFSLQTGERLSAQILEARVAQEQARTAAATESAALHDRLWQDRATLLSQELVAAQRAGERQWWESPPLWFAIGVLVSGVLVAVLAAAVGG